MRIKKIRLKTVQFIYDLELFCDEQILPLKLIDAGL